MTRRAAKQPTPEGGTSAAPSPGVREHILDRTIYLMGTLGTTDKLIKENPKLVSAFVRATLKALRYVRQDKEGTTEALVKFSGVTRQQANRVYDDLIGTFTQNGSVDEEAQRNDLAIVRQVVNGNETVPIARAYDFSFAHEADQQLNKAGWKP